MLVLYDFVHTLDLTINLFIHITYTKINIMEILVKNVVKLFVHDTHICAVNALQLMKYQMEKHNWTYEQWNEYYQVYRNNLNNVGLAG